MFQRKKRGKQEKYDRWEHVRMSESLEERYREILHPTKNAEEAINVSLADQLENYLHTYVFGEAETSNFTNFNSAAFMIQGCSQLYSKKVEYIYNLASNLHETLTKTNSKDESEVKKKDPKERSHRQSKPVDPFCSTEIKVGKNLSCLRKKNSSKTASNKKSSKKTAEKKHAFVPVDLLPLECEEKGDVFYDTNGDAVGNKNDYALNKCRITTSGWLLLPTVSPDHIDQPPEDLSCSSDFITPAEIDEGYPASSGCPSVPSSQDVIASQGGSSQQSDEGLGGSLMCTPSDGPSQPEAEVVTPMEEDDDDGCAASDDMENVPMDDFPENDELPPTRKPLRRSIRNALQQMQLQQAEAKKKQSGPKEDLFAVRKPIEKNSTVCYPPGMREKDKDQKPKPPRVFPASVYCARTFFSVDDKVQKKDAFSLQCKAFANNTKFLNKIKSYQDAINAAKRASRGRVATDSDEEGLDVVKDSEDDEASKEKKTSEEDKPSEEEDDKPSEEEKKEEDFSFVAHPEPLGDDFDNDIDDVMGAVGGDDEDPSAEGPSSRATESAPDDDVAGPSFEFDGEDFDRIAEEQMALFRDDLQTVEQTAEMNRRVRKWEQRLKPFLEDISKRKKFDIHDYGSHILDAFEESNRRQTILFQRFCEGMEKYEIHRYFLALLPLVNVGNVSISNEPCEDGEGEDIAITLLSRKMHHMELEEFAHNEGQHD